MKIFNLPEYEVTMKFSGEYTYESANKDFQRQLAKYNIEAAFYFYYSCDYCGSGEMLMYKDEKWYYHDMGHCSCYGPLDDENIPNFDIHFADNLDDIRAKCSQEQYRNLRPLINMAKFHGYDKQIYRGSNIQDRLDSI